MRKMVDWTQPMQQTYEFYVVDATTWKDKYQLYNVTACSIDMDESAQTLGSASISCTSVIDECYVRIYLITVQNGVRDSHPLGTFLVQTPTDSYDGKTHNITLDAYTPLIELKENQPPVGYTLMKNQNIMDAAYRLMDENMRPPVISTSVIDNLQTDFIANADDTWLSYLTDLIKIANYKLGLDEMSNVLFVPIQDEKSLQPLFTYTDDNSSILLPSIQVDRDLYGIPNVLEIVYSTGNRTFYATAINDDPNSPISTVGRGRKITKRVTDIGIPGNPTQSQLNRLAVELLRNMSSLEYQVSYTHGYNGVRVGDCIRLNYERAGLIDVKARVISQSIQCVTGCTVNETAVFSTNLWG